MTRRDILGPDTGYEPGGGYAGLLTTRETLKAIAIGGPLIGAIVLFQIWFGTRLTNDLTRLAMALYWGFYILRTFIHPERLRSPSTTAAHRLRVRLICACGLLVAAGAIAISIHSLFVPE